MNAAGENTAALAEGESLAGQDLKRGSKSFALAGLLLPPRVRQDAAVCYAFCRYVDDAVDEVPPEQAAPAVVALRALVDDIYAGKPQTDPRLQAFAALVFRTKMPREYPLALVDGMAMDAQGTRYDTLADLLLYCHRVAGVVGLMMCHVLGVRDNAALPQAAHLGIAMQLTNICRDVAEDWARGRLYIPRALAEVPYPQSQGALPEGLGSRLQPAVKTLLAEAELYYKSGQKGLMHLSWRAAFAIRVAAWVYRDIGRGVARRQWDVTRGRVIISLPRKLCLAGGAFVRSIFDLPARCLSRRGPLVLPTQVPRYPDDILFSH